MIPGGRQVNNYIQNIFVWDSYSSTSNPNNIDLWQQIYDNSLKTDCIVVVKSTTGNYNDSIFLIPKNYLSSNSSQIIYSIPQSSLNSTDSTKTSAGNISKVTTITISNGVVTKITAMSNSNGTSGAYLRTDYNYGTPYTPLYNGSPATKKYVDDSVANCKLSNVFFCTKDSISYTNNTTMWNDLYVQQKEEDCYLISTTGDNNITILYTIPQNYLTNTTSTSQVKTITSSPYGLNTFTVGNSTTKDGLYKCTIDITIVSDNITTVGNQINSLQYGGNYLSTTTQYSTPYTPLYSGSPATKKYADDIVIVGDETDASDNTMIIFDEDELDYVTEVVDSMEDNETDKAPSVSSIKDYLQTNYCNLDQYKVLYNDSTKTGSTGTITLNDNPQLYNTIRIMGYIICTDNNSIQGSFSQDIYLNTNTSYISQLNVNVYNMNEYNYMASERLTFVNTGSITRGTQKIYRNDQGLFGANIFIVTVLGYKRSF